MESETSSRFSYTCDKPDCAYCNCLREAGSKSKLLKSLNIDYEYIPGDYTISDQNQDERDAALVDSDG